MTEPGPNIVTLVWRIVIAACILLARIGLDRLSFRGQTRRSRRHGH